MRRAPLESNVHDDAIQRLTDGGVIAVLRGIDPDDVVPVARASVEGGVGAVEVTVDSPDAMEAIASVSEALGDEALVGAGTVLDAETAVAARRAGAAFVVSPSVHRDVIEACNRHGVVVVPGAATPTEAVEATEAGADLVKLFPAAPLGVDYLAAIRGPLPEIPFVPTGGVDADNAGRFVEAGAVAVAAGGSIVDTEAVERGDFDRVTRRARELVDAVEAAR